MKRFCAKTTVISWSSETLLFVFGGYGSCISYKTKQKVEVEEVHVRPYIIPTVLIWLPMFFLYIFADENAHEVYEIQSESKKYKTYYRTNSNRN